MFSLFRTLSLRYMTRHWVRAGLVIASIALGVAAWIATEALQGAVRRSLRQAASPLRGDADFYVTNFATRFVDASLKHQLEQLIGGIDKVHPFILENIKIGGRTPTDAVLLGLSVSDQDEDRQQLDKRGIEIVDLNTQLLGVLAFKNKTYTDHLPRFIDLTPSNNQPISLRRLVGSSIARIVQVEPVLVGEQFDKEVLQGRTGRPDAQGNIQWPQFIIEAGDRRLPVIVVGKVRATGPASTVGGQAVLMRWEAAANLLGRPGKVHRLDVKLKPDADREEVIRQADSFLIGRAKVQTADKQDERLLQVLKGLETGFMLCGAGALVVGLFLVYNAMSVSVAERRHDIGILRSVGATRMQIRLLFLAEALVMGVTGVLLGLPLGLLVARVALGPIQDLLQGIFLPVPRDAIHATVPMLLRAGLSGLFTALMAALVPASRAASEQPADTVRRAPPSVSIAYRIVQLGGSLTLIVLGVVMVAVKEHLTPLLVTQTCLTLVGVGVALIAAGYFLLGRSSVSDPATTIRQRPVTAIVYGFIFIAIGCGGLALRDSLLAEKGYAALVLILLGTLLLTPVLAAGMTRILQSLLRPILPIEARLAMDNLVRSPGRTGLVIAALAAGVALTVQTAGMIKSNEMGYREWLDASIRFDLYLTAQSAPGTGQARTLPASLADELFREKLLPPGTRLVGRVHRFPEWDAKNRRSGPGGSGGGTIVFMELIDANAHYQAQGGRPEELDLWRQLGEKPGRAIVSENFALIHGVRKGDTIQLEGNEGAVSFEIIGIIVDYNWIRGSFWIDRQHNKSAFAADEVNAWDVYLPADKQHQIPEIRDTIQRSQQGARYTLAGLTQAEVRDNYLAVIYKLFGLAYTQEVVVGIVVVIGVVTALLISVLGRTRELGLLRAVGGTRRQIMYTVLAEAVLIGFVGTLLGIAIGLPLEWYVVRVILFEEAGFLFAMRVPWFETVVITLLAMGSATLAGFIPAMQATRLRISDAIAYE